MQDRRAVTGAMQQLLHTAGAVADSVWTGASPRMHHLETGRGEPCVLLHGGTGGGANWFRILPLLAPHVRVLAPDFPGFGLSDAVTPTRPLGTTGADVIAEWLAANGVRRAHVVGTSFGGLVALRLAQRHPDRVASLFLLDAAGLGAAIHPVVRLASSPPLSRALMQTTRRGTRILLRSLLTSDMSDMTASHIHALVDYLYQTSRAAGTAYVVRTLRDFTSPTGQREVVTPNELMAIAQRAIIMWGARDRMLPLRHAHRAAAHLPHADLHVLPRAGHSPNWEAPDVVARAILSLAS